MRILPLVACVLAAAAGLAGCLGDEPPDAAPSPLDPPPASPPASSPPPRESVATDPACAFEPGGCAIGRPAVVAVVSTGVNPYHARLRLEDPRAPAEGIPRFPKGVPPLDLTFGPPMEEALRADADAWAGLEPEAMRTIPGTRVAGAISFLSGGTLALDGEGTGTAVASAVVHEAPSARLAIVQVDAGSLLRGVSWAAAQPWVDVLLVVPPPDASEEGLAALPAALREAAGEGKLVLVPAVPGTAGARLPPEVLNVGAAEPQDPDKAAAPAAGVDFAGDASPVVARHDDAQRTFEPQGTPYAAGAVAGILAETWSQSLGPKPALGAGEVLKAAQAAASAAAAKRSGSAPLGCMETGWGYLEAAFVPQMVSMLSSGEAPEPDSTRKACMEAIHAARGTGPPGTFA